MRKRCNCGRSSLLGHHFLYPLASSVSKSLVCTTTCLRLGGGINFVGEQCCARHRSCYPQSTPRIEGKWRRTGQCKMQNWNGRHQQTWQPIIAYIDDMASAILAPCHPRVGQDLDHCWSHRTFSWGSQSSTCIAILAHDRGKTSWRKPIVFTCWVSLDQILAFATESWFSLRRTVRYIGILPLIGLVFETFAFGARYTHAVYNMAHLATSILLVIQHGKRYTRPWLSQSHRQPTS